MTVWSKYISGFVIVRRRKGNFMSELCTFLRTEMGEICSTRYGDERLMWSVNPKTWMNERTTSET
jgi:hypothetical protein